MCLRKFRFLVEHTRELGKSRKVLQEKMTSWLRLKGQKELSRVTIVRGREKFVPGRGNMMSKRHAVTAAWQDLRM